MRNKGAESMPDDTESNVLIGEDKQHSRERAILNAINRVFREALTCDSDKQVAKQCLAVAEELTGSKFGFIGELNKEGQLDTIAMSDPGWSACNIPEADPLAMLRNMPIRDICDTALRAGQSQIINDPDSHPDREGSSQGPSACRLFPGCSACARRRYRGPDRSGQQAGRLQSGRSAWPSKLYRCLL